MSVLSYICRLILPLRRGYIDSYYIDSPGYERLRGLSGILLTCSKLISYGCAKRKTKKTLLLTEKFLWQVGDIPHNPV